MTSAAIGRAIPVRVWRQPAIVELEVRPVELSSSRG
jgi:hypothetical protein